MKIKFKNFLGTIESFFRNDATVARNYQFQDRDGTIADDTDLASKQDELISATNIKTINGSSILGSGNLVVGGGGSGTVESVTGDGVDNTDPDNPVLNFPISSEVQFTTTPSISATNVQAAIEEVDNEKAPIASPAFTGTVSGITNSMVGLGNVDNTSDANKPVSTAQQTALNLKENAANKDATGGYAGLTLFKINFKNVLNTFTSFFTNSNTAARTYTFQDRNGTIADDTDLALKSGIIQYAQTVYIDELSGSDATGAINRADKPYKTIDAALDASTAFTYTVLRIGPGTYNSPTPAKTRANSWYFGSGKPAYNVAYSQTAYATFTITDPTKLIGGTILRGNLQFIDKSNIKLYDLGVDCGSDYVTAGGTEGNCIGIASNTASAPFPMIVGIEIINVSTLGRNAASLFHGIVMENVYEPILQNIDTYFATHGIALKGIGSNISNVRSHKHNLDGLILKSDSYAFNWRTRATNLEITDCGTGIIVQYGSGSQGNGQVTVSNATMNGCATGVKLNALAAGVSDAIHFFGIRVIGASTRGFDISTSAFTKINDCFTRTCGDGFYVRTAATTSVNILENCTAIQNSSDGFDVDAVGGGRILLTDCYAAFSTGYGFNAGSNVDVAGYKGLTNTAGLLNGTVTSQMVNNPMTAVGDLIIGGTGGVPTVLADIAANNVLTSGGVGVAPAYGKVTLTGHVSGILPVANGGTNTSTAFTAGSVVFAGASGTYTQDATNFFFDDSNNRLGIKRNTPLSTLDVDGSFGTAITTISTTTSVQETYHTILVDATSGAVTVNLPVAAVVNGREYIIKKIDSSGNAVTIDGNGSEVIDGATTQTVTAQWNWKKIKSNGTAWFIIGIG